MSLECECVECGGTNQFAMCENALLNSRIKWHKKSKKQTVIDAVLLCVLLTLTAVLLHREMLSGG